MKVKRIVSSVVASDVEKASAFYEEVLGLKVLMDLGWIRTYGSGSKLALLAAVSDLRLRLERLERLTAQDQWRPGKHE